MTLRDLLLPATDAGVAMQLAIVLIAGTTLGFVARRRSEQRLLVIGATLLLVAAIGARALH